MIRGWLPLLIFCLTIPVRVQALVICLEPDGQAAVELSAPLGCEGCPDAVSGTGFAASEHDCGCTDLSTGSSLSTARNAHDAPALEVASARPFASPQTLTLVLLRAAITPAAPPRPPSVHALLRSTILLL